MFPWTEKLQTGPWIGKNAKRLLGIIEILYRYGVLPQVGFHIMGICGDNRDLFTRTCRWLGGLGSWASLLAGMPSNNSGLQQDESAVALILFNIAELYPA